MSILPWHGLAVTFYLTEALRWDVARSSNVTKRSRGRSICVKVGSALMTSQRSPQGRSPVKTQINTTTARSVHQDRHHHLLNTPSPPLPTPRPHLLPASPTHGLRVRFQHSPRPTARATPPPAPRPAASSPAGLYSASDRTPLGAGTPTPYHQRPRSASQAVRSQIQQCPRVRI
jgi:hypothetical protein